MYVDGKVCEFVFISRLSSCALISVGMMATVHDDFMSLLTDVQALFYEAIACQYSSIRASACLSKTDATTAYSNTLLWMICLCVMSARLLYMEIAILA